MMISVEQYASAFETWWPIHNNRTGVATHDAETEFLGRWLRHIRDTFDSTPRDPDEFCRTYDAFVRDGDKRVASTIRMQIGKSCLLSRLVYIGEPLRTEKCPIHKGVWSGIQIEACPHGCNAASCGCTTGWLPTRAILLDGEKGYMESIARLREKGRDMQADIFERQLEIIRKHLAEVSL